MRGLLLLLAAVFGIGEGASAFAQTTTLWTSGPIGRWSVTAAQNAQGNVFCYMSNLAGGSGIGYAVFRGGSMRIVLMHNEWNIPPGSRARISMQIDGYPLWTMNAVRSVDAANSIIVDARFDDAAVRFLREVRAGNWLVVTFPTGQSYRVSLEGSDAAVQQLYYCNQRYVLGSGPGNPMGN